jgi:TetR/AcrR family transcriptional repressor of nem operon
LPKGAFFNHFGSKEAFAVEVLRRYFERWQLKIASIVNDPRTKAIESLRALLAAATDGAQDSSYSFGCMVGNLSTELSSEHDSIRLTLSEIFRDRALTFETVIETGQKTGELTAGLRPAQAAHFLVNGSRRTAIREATCR